MPYLMLDDFASGIDLRKGANTAKPGTLRVLDNGFVTAGGEIEKRKTLTSVGVLPAGKTHGVSFDGTNVVVFGKDSAASVGALPPYVTYKQLTVADGRAIARILDVQTFAGKDYVIVRHTDGTIRHYYDGTRVPDSQVVGTNVRAHKGKMYCVDKSNLRFSVLLNPAEWQTGTGRGIIDVSTEDAAGGNLVGLEQYYSYLTLFSRTSVQVWQMDPDPAKNVLQQVLGNVGLVAPNAVTRYGNGDVLFLSDTDIRSLRARDTSTAATLNDVGSPVDNLIAAKRATLTADEAEKITALVDPLTGRFWLAWGNEVIALSTYPNSKVSAWSKLVFSRPIDYIALANSRIVIRQGDDLFVYGSTPGAETNPFDPNTPIGIGPAVYDATQVTVETPFLDASTPAANKIWTGIDVTCSGTWEVYVNPDTESAKWTLVATLDGDTWSDSRVPLDMTGQRIAVRLVSKNNGPASLSSMALHYQEGTSD
jgi:hypothetical protein